MSLNILTIPEVGAKIKRRNLRATKKWLLAKKIIIHRDGRSLFVYEIDVDTEIDKIKVRDLQVKYPNNWQDVYRKISKDQSVYEMVIYSLGGENFTKPTTRLKAINKEESDFLKKYRL